MSVWEITENEDFFQQYLHEFSHVSVDLGIIKHLNKRLQFLASRYLILELIGPQNFSCIKKTPKGKIYINANPGIHLSVSHSGNFVAVVVSTVPVGVDIQEYDQRLRFLFRKFINESEKKWISSDDPFLDYHLIWGAKESIFKAWGEGDLDFKDNMVIFPPNEEAGESGVFKCIAKLKKNTTERNFRIWSYARKKVFLVVAMQKGGDG